MNHNDDDIDDMDIDDEVVHFVDEVVQYRMIPRRTNWRYRYLVLNQQEVVTLSAIQLSISYHAELLFLIILLTTQLLTVLQMSSRRNADQNIYRRQRMAPVVRFYTRLVVFCYLSLDNLFLEEEQLVGITRDQ